MCGEEDSALGSAFGPIGRIPLQPRMCTKQAYAGVGVFLLATGGKVQAVIAIELSDIMVGVGTVENGAPAVRQ